MYRLLGFLAIAGAACATHAAEPVALRMETFLVAPSHTPSAVVVARNLQPQPYQGTIRLQGPEGWQLEPAEQAIHLAPGATERVRFLVRRAATNETGSYALVATAEGAGSVVTRNQHVLTTSAPYFKPEIDGQVDDWKDAIPVRWSTGGQETVVRTYWNRRQFAFLVEVQESRLVALEPSAAREGFDAIQIALAAENTTTGRSPDEVTARFEFLVVASGDPPTGICYQLAHPGMPLAATQEKRDLAPQQYDDATIAVRREGDVTRYECSLPFRPLRDHIRPSEGREFRLSVLVHDPDGTGVRDWGAAAGLWPCERNRLAWSDWPGAQWGADPPFDSKTPWGLCSSKY